MATATVLVADDDSDVVTFVELTLGAEGFHVVRAADGPEALRVAEAEHPDIIVLDVMMPGLSGNDVCRRLRADPRNGSVGIIMLTARQLPADRVTGLVAGADDYITKPFDPGELVARIRTALRRASEMSSLSPLTRLPGNVQIETEIVRRMSAGEPVSLLHVDIDRFKAFNDHYGFLRGDDAIRYAAETICTACGPHQGTFVGHIGGDDFVVVTDPSLVEEISGAIIERFDAGVTALYDAEDAVRRSIEVEDRAGRRRRFPLITISIGVADAPAGTVADHRALIQVATEMKSLAKKHRGSAVARNRRRIR